MIYAAQMIYSCAVWRMGFAHTQLYSANLKFYLYNGVRGCGSPVGAVDKTVFFSVLSKEEAQKQRKMEEVITE